MWEVELKPEIRKELTDPEKYVKGINMTYNGMTITMVGVIMMLILYFTRPEHVHLIVAGWGEWIKFRAK